MAMYSHNNLEVIFICCQKLWHQFQYLKIDINNCACIIFEEIATGQ